MIKVKLLLESAQENRNDWSKAGMCLTSENVVFFQGTLEGNVLSFIKKTAMSWRF